MATTNSAPVFSSDSPLSPHLVEYLGAMEERIVSRLLAALRPMYEAGALEQMLAKMIPVVVASVQEAMSAAQPPTDNNTTSTQTPRESLGKQTRSRSAAITPRHSKQYKDVTQNPKCTFEELCTAFEVLKPHQTFDEYYLDVASKKPLPSLSKAEEHILLHAPRVVSVLDYASNIPLPDITSDEEFSDDSSDNSSDDVSLFSSVSSCSTFTTEAPMSPEFDQAIERVEDSTELHDVVGDDKSTPAEVKAPIDAVSAEPSTTIESTRAPQSNDGATDPPVTEYNNEDGNDNNGTVHVAASSVHENQPNTHDQTHSTDSTDRDVSTSELLIVLGSASQTEAMEVCIPEPTHSRPVDSQNMRAELSQTMDGIESPPAPRDISSVVQDDMDDVQVTSRVDTEEQNMVDAPPPESTTESRARSRVQANTSNHWSNGMVNYLLELIPDLHHVLKQALPQMVQEKEKSRIRDEIFDYIGKAESARGLANDLDFAMKNSLMTNAEYHRVKEYAQNAAKSKHIGSSQTAANSTAQSASLSAPPETSIKDQFIGLLIEARRKMMNKNEQNKLNSASDMFEGQFNISFEKSSDIEVMIDYLTKQPRFQACDSNGKPMIDVEKTVEIIQALVEDVSPRGSEEIVWRCMEALAAQDLKAENEALSDKISCAIRQEHLQVLFERIAERNFGLCIAKNIQGGLTWDEMKDLAKKEERHYFELHRHNRSRRNNLPTYLEHMDNKRKYWGHRDNMRNEITRRRAAQNQAIGQPPATDPVGGVETAGSFQGKRSIADIPHDDNEQAQKRMREEPAEPNEEQERTATRKRDARGPADSESSERVKRSRD
ncbi:uncharacterized protein J4E78_004060 [Alternaria triticimaculans]|uniref:uncharacterized protein n=1 Tax=Alternaria triticimaculans TaxID=297637 RepID=UPI0020C50664|nr:uncharacterized protein J4E78_004060 [Alternaria triticimaculans]KAI4663644.1 hypothetical protein J4E78_004060 [Alternaria triticimaculans]